MSKHTKEHWICDSMANWSLWFRLMNWLMRLKNERLRKFTKNQKSTLCRLQHRI